MRGFAPGAEQEGNLPVGNVAAAAHHRQDRPPSRAQTLRRQGRKPLPLHRLVERARPPVPALPHSSASGTSLLLRPYHPVQVLVRQRVHRNHDSLLRCRPTAPSLNHDPFHVRRQRAPAHLSLDESAANSDDSSAHAGGKADVRFQVRNWGPRGFRRATRAPEPEKPGRPPPPARPPGPAKYPLRCRCCPAASNQSSCTTVRLGRAGTRLSFASASQPPLPSDDGSPM